MCHSNCDHKWSAGCVTSMIGKILLVVGGLNWGLVGIGMLMNSDWNVVYMLLGKLPTLEAVVYILVGVAAIAGIFGCKCTKCMDPCGACDHDKAGESM
ncbi:hypothetical protein A2738_02460 [Candidatus Nomurabacteria bacterium RIFCSPHIGHO2_01_FULL_42_15]|uniref:DUF378 domain-containing protein n=1 Tax=Candidatus Nomurabacteria bacterium RIFCSPHIGHO2_01_FULL_42_15 TaxID=1801742 RepID=A0A1F6VF80_9BACT|nr:MAG: hypothetical protein A2738_02460 [Candidatus Nomurabacteria bacterium RIFCSPHIGHO2_01_FULL_42_15]OGI93458.1 MAG: hypothetical protein A3A99_02190 [Candidatus Nomurabacteria bacterium RIFCSPLOWO2_01_FULL_41_18]